MSTHVGSLDLRSRNWKIRSPFYVRTASERLLALFTRAMRRLFRAMEESNRRKAEQVLRQHPFLLQADERQEKGS